VRPGLTVLSDRDILAAIARGELAIDPLDERRLTPNGYDLGVAEVALPDSGTRFTEGTARVPPRARFAVSTQERVRLGAGLTGQLWLRTTWARRGVLASFGRVDAGFDGMLTLAAHNASESELELPVGATFAQLVIEPLTSDAAATYEERSGHYQHQQGVTLAPGTVPPKREAATATRTPAGQRGAPRTSTVRAPCIERGCHECCLDTEMPLTEEDLERLRAIGHAPEDVSVTATDGGLLLRNTDDGRCALLGPDGRCAAYEARPEGCTLYPLVLDEASGDVVIDQVCPHAGAVGHSRRDEDRVRTLLVRIERERRSRTSSARMARTHGLRGAR